MNVKVLACFHDVRAVAQTDTRLHLTAQRLVHLNLWTKANMLRILLARDKEIMVIQASPSVSWTGTFAAGFVLWLSYKQPAENANQ
jgi:hypothetical protein